MKKNIFVNLFVLLILGLGITAHAQSADTIDVITQNKVVMTSPPLGYYGWGVFPADTESYRKVYLNFTLGCPSGGCSGWDYTVDIYLIQNTHHIDSTLIQGPSFTVNGNQDDSVKVKFDTTYTTYFDTTTHLTDSTVNAAYAIIQYESCATPTVATDTVHWWVAGYYNYYYNTSGNKIDSIFVTQDTSMYISYCPYYSKYDSLATYELARMITPYGGYYGATWSNPYKFDITDFSSLLHDSVQIEVFYSGWTDGFTATCDFQMITGIPDHKPYKAINLWSGSFPYGSAANPISNYLTKYGAHIDTGAHATRLRILQTGHGEDANNCTEFCANFQFVYVNGIQEYAPLVWRTDCGLNALWHQSGTWLYDRANWCPGDLVNPYLDDLTPYVTRGGTDTLQIAMAPYTSPNGGSIYIFGTSLIYYGAPSFNLDAAVEDIISPNIYAPYSRTNPNCGDPEVVIRNTGAQTLDSLTFYYGEIGSAHNTYTWHGSLPFDDTALVYLPHVSLKPGTSNKFEVTISNPNGGTDQYANNNYMQVAYDTVPTYASIFVIRLETNTIGGTFSYFIENDNGNRVVSKSGFSSSTTYKDTVSLAPGCYHFELDAADEQGLSFFANSYGNGTLAFTKLDGVPFNNFQADFGTSVCQNFTVGGVSGINNLVNNVDYLVYPNPARTEITLAGLNTSAKDKTVRMYSSLGTLVYETNVSAGIEKYDINLENFASGMYCVIISNADGQVVKKIMVTR